MTSGNLDLPPLITLASCGGDRASYEDLLWAQFRNDFLVTTPNLHSWPVKVDRTLGVDGKEKRFWHLTNKGEEEESREFDPLRSQRIAWIRWVVENADSERVCEWQEKTRNGRKTKLALSDFSYLVVLKKTAKFYLLITAFWVERQHQRLKLQKEYERYISRSTQ